MPGWLENMQKVTHRITFGFAGQPATLHLEDIGDLAVEDLKYNDETIAIDEGDVQERSVGRHIIAELREELLPRELIPTDQDGTHDDVTLTGSGVRYHVHSTEHSGSGIVHMVLVEA